MEEDRLIRFLQSPAIWKLDCSQNPPLWKREKEGDTRCLSNGGANLQTVKHAMRSQFYHNVSRKACAKPRSLSRSSNEELGQRIEARLLASEKKRLKILVKAHMRLAKLDELRQAAKTSVEIRSERERVKLGTQVESRVQKTEANRMKILMASHQKRACAKERMS